MDATLRACPDRGECATVEDARISTRPRTARPGAGRLLPLDRLPDGSELLVVEVLVVTPEREAYGHAARGPRPGDDVGPGVMHLHATVRPATSGGWRVVCDEHPEAEIWAPEPREIGAPLQARIEQLLGQSIAPVQIAFSYPEGEEESA